MHFLLYITVGAYFIKTPANEVRKEATILSFPTLFKPHSTLSKALCATAPITLIPCAMIFEIFIMQGPFKGTLSPFRSHPLANERKLLFTAESKRDAAE